MKRLVQPVCYGMAILILFCVSPVPAQQGARNGEWRTYGGDEGSTRYSPLDQINRTNINNMPLTVRSRLMNACGSSRLQLPVFLLLALKKV